jgi:metal-responsive CopG/Arc/MetJ family transcriptional regulator
MPADTSTRKFPKRAVTKETARPVLVYFPEDIVSKIDRCVVSEDTDRSKWMRQAMREALQRRGIATSH